jgi:hypothetical protein
MTPPYSAGFPRSPPGAAPAGASPASTTALVMVPVTRTVTLRRTTTSEIGSVVVGTTKLPAGYLSRFRLVS